MSLSRLLKAAKVTTEMVNRRDMTKVLYGTRYAKVTEDARLIILAVAARDMTSPLEAALTICEDARKDGQDAAINLVIAAVVDLIEGAKS